MAVSRGHDSLLPFLCMRSLSLVGQQKRSRVGIPAAFGILISILATAMHPPTQCSQVFISPMTIEYSD